MASPIGSQSPTSLNRGYSSSTKKTVVAKLQPFQASEEKEINLEYYAHLFKETYSLKNNDHAKRLFEVMDELKGLRKEARSESSKNVLHSHINKLEFIVCTQLNEPGDHGGTPLQGAVHARDIFTLKKLIAFNPDFKIREPFHGGTVLHVAVDGGSAECVAELLRHAPELVLLKNKNKVSALNWAEIILNGEANPARALREKSVETKEYTKIIELLKNPKAAEAKNVKMNEIESSIGIPEPIFFKDAWSDEPLTNVLKETNISFALPFPDLEMSLVAPFKGRTIGQCSMNLITKYWIHIQNRDFSKENISTQIFIKIQQKAVAAEKKYLEEILGIPAEMCGHNAGIAVLHEFRGNKIGLNLAKQQIEVCKNFKLKALFMETTNFFSHKIANELEFHKIEEFSYAKLSAEFNHNPLKKLEDSFCVWVKIIDS